MGMGFSSHQFDPLLDVTQCVFPSIVYYEPKSRIYFSHPMFARVANKILSYEVVKYIMVLCFLPTSIRRQIVCYYIHVLKNDK